MGKQRRKSRDDYDIRSKKSNRVNVTRHEESDNDSFYSDLEDSCTDEYDSRFIKADSWMSDSDNSEYSSDSDGSYSPPKGKKSMNSSRERSRSKTESRSRSRSYDSDSDESGAYDARDKPGNNRSRGASGKRGQSRNNDGYGSSCDKNSDDRSCFSSRIGRIKRGEDSSFNSDEDSESDSQSSHDIRSTRREVRGSGSDSNQLPQKPTRQISQRSLNLNSQEQMQTTVPPRNNPQMMPSSSLRSMPNTRQNNFPGSGVLVNKPLVNQGQGQRMADISGNNLQGHANQRLPAGPGYMMRSMSGRSINSSSSGLVQLNRSVHGATAQPPLQDRPATMRVASQRSLGNSSLLPDTPKQRQVPMRGASNRSLGNMLPTPSMYPQQSELMRGASKHNRSNSDALLNSSISGHQPGLMSVSSRGNLGNNDGLLNTAMHSQQTGLMSGPSHSSLANNNPLLNNNKPMPSQFPGTMRGPPQRGLGNSNVSLNASSIQSNPNVRIDTIQQPNVRTKNSRWAVKRSEPEPSSVTGDSVLVTPNTCEDISALSSSRRSSAPGSLADQIFSRSRNRHGDTQSLGSFKDPPGTDSKHWKVKKGRRHSETLSYDSFREDEESYVATMDPPDMFDDDGGGVGAELEPDKGRVISLKSINDRQDFYNEDPSNVSSFDEDDVYSKNIRFSGDTAGADASVCESSISASSSVRGQRREATPGKSSSRFCSELAFEYDQQADPRKEQADPPEEIPALKLERRNVDSNESNNDTEDDPPEEIPALKLERRNVDSNESNNDNEDDPPEFKLERRNVDSNESNKDNEDEDKVNNVATATQESSMSWLAQQISNRKLARRSVRSCHLEPEGLSNDGRANFSSKNSIFESSCGGKVSRGSEPGGQSLNIFNELHDDKVNQRDYSEMNNNRSLPPEIDYIFMHTASNAALPSSAKTDIQCSDDTTTTTGTMTQEVPSVIVRMNDMAKDSCTDVDSLLSTSDDESKTLSSSICASYNSENMRYSFHTRNGRRKKGQKSSKQKRHTAGLSRTEMYLKEMCSEERKSVRNLRSNDALREVKKHTGRDTLTGKGSKNKNTDGNMKSLKKNRERRNMSSEKTTRIDVPCSRASVPSDIEETLKSTKRFSLQSDEVENSSDYKMQIEATSRPPSRASGTRKPKKSRSFQAEKAIDEKRGFESQSVMGLIDQLKSFEMDRI